MTNLYWNKILAGLAVAVSAVSATPTFTLLSSRSGLLDPKVDIPQVEVTFEDGQKDTLVLEHYNAMPHSKNIDPLRLCNYLGHLKNEKTARVAVTGCVDDRNLEGKMYISMISKRSPYQKRFSMDLDGTVNPIHLTKSNDAYKTTNGHVVSREGGEFQDYDEIGEIDVEAAAEASTTDGVPYNLKITVKIGTDTAAINKIVNGLGRTVDDWLAEMFTHVQNHYHHATLQHKINFEISGPTLNFGEELTVSSDDLGKLSQYTKDANDDNIDLFIWVVDGAGPYTGLAWLGSACVNGGGGWSKTSVTRGPSRGNAIVETAETLAHEVGHNLGMSHSFIDRENGVSTKCRAEDDGSEKTCNQCANWDATHWSGGALTAQTEASGECCTGFMDYGSHPEYWSDCSVRMFEQHYVSRNWATCIPEDTTTPAATTPGATTAEATTPEPTTSDPSTGNEKCFDVVITTKRYGNENSWTLGTCKNDQAYENDQTYTESCCLNPGSYQLSCDDTYGDGWHGGYIEIEGTRYCEDFVSDHQQGHNIDIAHSDVLTILKVVTKSWGKENSWTLGACSSSQTYGNNENYEVECCQPAGEYVLTCKDTYGDGWHGGYLKIGDEGKKWCKNFKNGHEKEVTVTLAGTTPCTQKAG